MIAFALRAALRVVDDHRQAYGVEPICKVLPINRRPVASKWRSGAIAPSCRREPSAI